MAVSVIKTTRISVKVDAYGSFFKTRMPSPPPVTFSWALMTIASCATWKSDTVMGRGIRNSRIISCLRLYVKCSIEG